jgi:hypothetical protein
LGRFNNCLILELQFLGNFLSFVVAGELDGFEVKSVWWGDWNPKLVFEECITDELTCVLVYEHEDYCADHFSYLVVKETLSVYFEFYEFLSENLRRKVQYVTT